MPNNTETRVRIQGDCQQIDMMYSKLKDLEEAKTLEKQQVGFLEQFIGDSVSTMSDSEKTELVSPIGMPRWYAKRIEHWGTKWDVYNIKNVKVKTIPEAGGFPESSVLTCVWHTAWTPCIPAIVELSKQLNVDIVLEYLDEGLFFVGRTTIIDGKINLEQDYDGNDVYRGMYELFGKDFYFDWVKGFAELVDNDFKDDVFEKAKEYLDTENLSKLASILGIAIIVE